MYSYVIEKPKCKKVWINQWDHSEYPTSTSSWTTSPYSIVAVASLISAQESEVRSCSLLCAHSTNVLNQWVVMYQSWLCAVLADELTMHISILMHRKVILVVSHIHCKYLPLIGGPSISVVYFMYLCTPSTHMQKFTPGLYNNESTSAMFLPLQGY